jgi:molybdopterin/thiamine biosynthesis adenylyltransferase
VLPVLHTQAGVLGPVPGLLGTLQALEALGKWRRMFQPEAQVTVPVQFTFVAGPELVQDGKLVEAGPTLALSSKASVEPS